MRIDQFRVAATNVAAPHEERPPVVRRRRVIVCVVLVAGRKSGAGSGHESGSPSPGKSVPEIVGLPRLSDNARLAQSGSGSIAHGCDIPGRGDGIGRRSGLKHRRRKAWGFDFPPRHQISRQRDVDKRVFCPLAG